MACRNIQVAGYSKTLNDRLNDLINSGNVRLEITGYRVSDFSAGKEPLLIRGFLDLYY